MAKEATRSFVLRVDASTMEAVERWAADEFRSTNGQLQWIIMEALRRSGRLKKSRVGKPEPKPEKSESMRISFMRWRPGSDGREPRERRKWLEINGVPSRARFRMFIRNRLWIGLPPAFVAGFGVVLLLLVSGGESTPERSLVRASIAGSLCVFGWILGVWAATGPDSEPVAENSEQASGDRFAPRKLRWWLWILCGGAAICYAVFSPSIGRIVEGERTVLEGAAEIVSKVLTVVCVIVPVWLAERARR